MRRVATGLLAASLLVLALAAVVDALRGKGEQAVRPQPANQVEAPVAALRAAGARGTITYSDSKCRLHAFRLPTLEPVPAPVYRSCKPHIPSRGLAAWEGEVVWSGLGFHTVQVVLSRADLAAAVRRDPQAGRLAYSGHGPYRARQVVALGADRFAVVLENPRADWEPLLATFKGTRLIHLQVRAVGVRDVIRPSPKGKYLAVVHPDGGIDIQRANGQQFTEPSVTDPHAVAWSPDDRWTALATRYSVYLFLSQRPTETIRIPLAVRDLDWGT